MEEKFQTIKGFMNEQLTKIYVELTEIKSDLKYHIKRTDTLEKMITPLYKVKIWFTYTIIFLGIIATIKGIL